MTQDDMPAFVQMLTGLGVIYNKSINEPFIDLYWRALKKFELAAVKRALQAHLHHPDHGQFMPKPADVVRYLEGSQQTRAMQAWSKVVDAMKRVGAHETIIFDDALIHAVIHDMGGWVYLCKTIVDELPFRAHEFEKRYSGFLQQPPLHYPRQLTGIIEHYNAMQGYFSPAPVLFGDATQALRVYQNGHHAMGRMIQRLPELPPTTSAVTEQQINTTDKEN